MSSVRRLTAILAADVAGYSRLMGSDEEGTHERLKAHLRELVNPKERLLNIATGGAGNLHGDTGRHDTALDSGEEPFLAMFEQITNRGDIIGGEVDLGSDFGIAALQSTSWLS